MRSPVMRTVLFLSILTLGYPALPLLGQQTQTPEKKSTEQKAEDEKKPKVTEEMVG